MITLHPGFQDFSGSSTYHDEPTIVCLTLSLDGAQPSAEHAHAYCKFAVRDLFNRSLTVESAYCVGCFDYLACARLTGKEFMFCQLLLASSAPLGGRYATKTS